MEFSSIWYFSFWSLISIVFSATGIYALQNATIPVSDVLKQIFELSFALSMSCCISYALLFRPALEEHDDQALKDSPSNKLHLNCLADYMNNYSSPLIYIILSANNIYSRNQWNTASGICFLVGAVGWLAASVILIILVFKNSPTIANFFTGFAGPLRMFPYHTFSWVLLQGFLMLSFLVYNSPLLWDVHIYLVLMSASIPSIFVLVTPHFKKLIATSSTAAYVYHQRKFIEIVCGMLANALIQYCFRVQSVALMLVYLSLAMAWLGNLANVQPSTDFGIFQFFVSMGLQSAVSLFGLHYYTFLVVLGGIVLMTVRWKMESVSLRHSGKRESVVRDWKRLEELFGSSSDFSNQTLRSEARSSHVTMTFTEEPGNPNI